MTATDPVQAVAEALAKHQPQIGHGYCNCGQQTPLSEDFTTHQARAAVAAARPTIEREAKAAAWDEGLIAGVGDDSGLLLLLATKNPYRIEREEQS